MKNSKHRSQHAAIPIEFLLVCLALTGTISSACTQGAGEGSVSSRKPQRLFVRNCWSGEFDLGPTFLEPIHSLTT